MWSLMILVMGPQDQSKEEPALVETHKQLHEEPQRWSEAAELLLEDRLGELG